MHPLFRVEFSFHFCLTAWIRADSAKDVMTVTEGAPKDFQALRALIAQRAGNCRSG